MSSLYRKSGVRQHSIIIGRTDTVKSVMASVRKWKKACRNVPNVFSIVAPNIDAVATAVMSAGLLGDAKNWEINTHSMENGGVDTEVSFLFSTGLPDDHDDAQSYIGGSEAYDDLETRVKDGSLPSCWFISNLNETRTRASSLSAFRTRAQKSLSAGECMHLGAAGSATRVLYDMVADARSSGTHVIEEMTIHNGKRSGFNGDNNNNNNKNNNSKRDVTFVHVILRPVADELLFADDDALEPESEEQQLA